MSGSKGIFEHLFVLARPAAGKSEFIDFMKKLADDDRAARFHIGKFVEIDDFPWLWDACVEDDRRQQRGEPRLVSEKTFEGYNITKPGFRSGLAERFNEAIRSRFLSNPAFYDDGTLLIEFARGREDGFAKTLGLFDPEILRRAAILFIDVSFEESFRKNSARYKPGMEESILFHKVPDRDMLGFFREHDWEDLTEGKREGTIALGPVDIPFVTMNNEPESTDPTVLGERYGAALRRLFELKSAA